MSSDADRALFLIQRHRISRCHRFATHGELKTGDVVLISIPNPNGGVPTEHAGSVVGKTKDGEPIIRQKPDADHPPIDLTQSQFEACYCQGKRIEQQRAAHQAGVYRKNEEGGSGK